MKFGLIVSLIFQMLITISVKAQGDFELPGAPSPNLKITCDIKQSTKKWFQRYSLDHQVYILNEYQGHEQDFCFLLAQKNLAIEASNLISNPWNRKVTETGTITFSDGISRSICSYKILKQINSDSPLNSMPLKSWNTQSDPDGDILFDLLYQNKDSLNEAVEVICENMFLS